MANAQELPPIIEYPPNVYQAANQNWMISQDEQGFIYVANNEGLLEFNGAQWRLYPSPNETIMRSVSVANQRIYTGCYMELGYWERNPDGELSYTSLVPKIEDILIDDEQFWNILQYEKWILFQSLNQIYIFDTQTENFTLVRPKNGVRKMFMVNGRVCFQSPLDGIYEIVNGSAEQLLFEPDLKGLQVVNMFAIQGKTVLLTESNGFYFLEGKKLTPWIIPTNKLLTTTRIYDSAQLTDNKIVLGTISSGMIVLTENGELAYVIKQSNGLGKNTVLSVFEDAAENIWLGLNNGINCVNTDGVYSVYNDDSGILGTVYATVVFNDNLYVGTNQGLFYRPLASADAFTRVDGTEGQVWNLEVYDGTLFCGHDLGTFTISNTGLKKVSNYPGTWKFEPISSRPDLVLQGNYLGFSVLQKINGEWEFRNILSEFPYSARFFELTEDNKIYVSHEYKGVYEMQIDQNLTQIKKIKQLKAFPKAKNAGLARYNDKILYGSPKGIYARSVSASLDSTFVKDTTLSNFFEEDGYISGNLLTDDTGKLWLFTEQNITYITPGTLSNDVSVHKVPIHHEFRRSVGAFDNVTNVGKENYLLGVSDGYIAVDLNKMSNREYEIYITDIHQKISEKEVRRIALKEEGNLEYEEAKLAFSFSIPVYDKYLTPEYQYRLDSDKDWSSWSREAVATYDDLSSGTFVFYVRGKVGNQISKNTARYMFTVSRPWYFSNLLILIYVLGAFLLLWGVNFAYQNYFKRQKQKLIRANQEQLNLQQLEAEQQIITLKNQQLSNDIEAKNRELAVSTMSLIRKNEFLTQIKKELKGVEDAPRTIKKVLRTIDQNISEEDNWNVFKEAFNNVDQDFLKRIKNQHTLLTPNDLRLCAYLRLNLSSKEIAPLLNISTRSVEIKRYRLRKKMDLEHEQGLVEYILEI